MLTLVILGGQAICLIEAHEGIRVCRDTMPTLFKVGNNISSHSS